MTTSTKSVVVFSQNYLPLNRINFRRAVTLLAMGKAEPIIFFEDTTFKEIRSPSIVIQVPPVIRLYQSAERPWKIPPVSRKEILRRDEHQCQYCGNRKQLTIDHIIPRSRGGKHIWNNVVIACADCNSRKGNKTPEEAKMTLLNKPKAPKHPTIAFAEQFWQEQQLVTDN
ncbi:HNH endonuclease [Hyella patelloides LEGE 07179]|uniref:HNH endonuclease n=1 Tax=Hyella patelloides LEGE 07179 TaxID=945734 RepID=A0A563VXM5_9CYAN|nr:HNH endonuclease [Hyella patelloides]VEP16202.1 HNH endonuclease [Hyella patelloides LEGE 07179]